MAERRGADDKRNMHITAFENGQMIDFITLIGVGVMEKSYGYTIYCHDCFTSRLLSLNCVNELND